MTKFSKTTRSAVAAAVASIDVVVQTSGRDITSTWNDAQTLARSYWKDEGSDGKILASARAVEAFAAGFAISTARYAQDADAQHAARAERLQRATIGARSYEALATLAGFRAADYTRGSTYFAMNAYEIDGALEAVDRDITAARKAADDAFNERCKAATGTSGTDRIQFVRG